MNRHPQETSRSQEIARINDLAVAAAYGGREAASQLIESLRPLMLKYARSFSLCGDPEDVCQDMAVYLLEFVRKTDVCKIKNFAGYFKMSMLKEFTKRVEREKERLALVEEIIASETEQISPSAEHESALFDGVTEGRITGVTNRFDNEEDLFSYRAGVVYKPADNASVYLSYANSKTPSKTSVNGACNANTCNVDPETAVNVELGTKWDVLENRLDE